MIVSDTNSFKKHYHRLCFFLLAPCLSIRFLFELVRLDSQNGTRSSQINVTIKFAIGHFTNIVDFPHHKTHSPANFANINQYIFQNKIALHIFIKNSINKSKSKPSTYLNTCNGLERLLTVCKNNNKILESFSDIKTSITPNFSKFDFRTSRARLFSAVLMFSTKKNQRSKTAKTIGFFYEFQI